MEEPAPLLQVESEQTPLTLGVRGRDMEFVMVSEPELESVASGGAMDAVDLTFLGIAAGTAGNALLAIVSGSLAQHAVTPVWWLLWASLLVTLYFFVRVILSRRKARAEIERMKGGPRVPMREDWVRTVPRYPARR